MRLILALILILITVPAQAQLITPTPQCAKITNESKFTMNGTLRTDYVTARDGTKRRHESNFRLAPGESKDACSTGPFYPDYQVELSLKTMFPVFTCKTRLEGTIYLRTEINKDTGGNKIYAVCVR